MTTTVPSTTDSTGNIPLTTKFTPPASCSSQSWISSDCSVDTCTGIYNIVRATESECYPSGWATTATTFSPGIQCPVGYSIAGVSTALLGAATNVETRGTCCPSGFEVATSNSQSWYEREPCIMRSKGVTTITYSFGDPTPTTTTAVTYPTPLIHAMPVGIAWQSSDIVSTSTPTLTSTPTSTSTSTLSGLSTGAKAGIGVGVSVGVIGIALVIGALVWFRRKRAGRNDPQSFATNGAPGAPVDNASAHNKTSTQGFTELDSVPLSSFSAELHGDEPQPRELEAKGISK